MQGGWGASPGREAAARHGDSFGYLSLSEGHGEGAGVLPRGHRAQRCRHPRRGGAGGGAPPFTKKLGEASRRGRRRGAGRLRPAQPPAGRGSLSSHLARRHRHRHHPRGPAPPPPPAPRPAGSGPLAHAAATPGRCHRRHPERGAGPAGNGPEKPHGPAAALRTCAVQCMAVSAEHKNPSPHPPHPTAG